MGNLVKGLLPREQGIWTNAEDATNGNHTIYSGSKGWASAAYPAFYTLDFEDEVEINQIRLLLFDGLGDGKVQNHRKYTFDINVSVDGNKFHKIFGGKPEHSGNGWFILNLSTRTKIKSVQFHGTGNTANKDLHIVEIEVYDNVPKLLPNSTNIKQFSVDWNLPEHQIRGVSKSKIFISHSRQNRSYGDALVQLLIDLGIEPKAIVFTSNPVHGIPNGENIFDWLKGKITEKPHIIFLLSPEYYKSTACVSEMGAAWIVGSQYTTIFSNGFDPNSSEFQSGPLDPRKMGFSISDEDRLLDFADSMMHLGRSERSRSFVNQKVRTFLKCVSNAETKDVEVKGRISETKAMPVEGKDLITENRKTYEYHVKGAQFGLESELPCLKVIQNKFWMDGYDTEIENTGSDLFNLAFDKISSQGIFNVRVIGIPKEMATGGIIKIRHTEVNKANTIVDDTLTFTYTDRHQKRYRQVLTLRNREVNVLFGPRYAVEGT